MAYYYKTLGEAEHYLKEAEHLLTESYPLLHEPKLLLVALKKINRAVKHAGAVVGKTQLRKPESKLMQDIDALVQKQKHSPVVFRRKQAMVICSEDYALDIVQQKTIKSYLEKAKLFIKHAHSVVKHGGR